MKIKVMEIEEKDMNGYLLLFGLNFCATLNNISY